MTDKYYEYTCMRFGENLDTAKKWANGEKELGLDDLLFICDKGVMQQYVEGESAERFHNDVRDRTKIMRGFHGSVKSADTILKGFVIYYNFIRKHQGIKCSPFELATDIKLDNPNKWVELIKLSV